MKRAERRDENRRAHAIRRELTDADYREAKAAGQSLTWLQVWDVYAAMSNADVLALEIPAPVHEAATPDVVTPLRRQAPEHVRAASEAYRLARAAWEDGLSQARRGANPDGRPARGERYTDEERDYRAEHPAPVYRDFLTAVCAERREHAETAAA